MKAKHLVAFMIASACGGASPRPGETAAIPPVTPLARAEPTVAISAPARACPAARGSGPQPVLQLGHTSRVYYASFSADGALLASGDASGGVNVWDVASGELRASLRGHQANVTSLDFSADGSVLASAGEDGRLALWDMRTGLARWNIVATEKKVWGVKLSPDGALVATRETDNENLWDARTGQRWASVGGNAGYAFAWSPDGRAFAAPAADRANAIAIWDVPARRVRVTLVHAKLPRDAAFGDGGRTLATAGGDEKKVVLWDTTTGAKRRELDARGKAVAVGMSRDGATVAAAIEGVGVDVWDARTGARRAEIAAKNASEWKFTLSGDGRSVAAATSVRSIGVFDAMTGAQARTLAPTTHADALMRFFSTPDGATVAVLSDRSPRVTLLDARTGAERNTLAGSTEAARSAHASPDGTELATVEEETTRVDVRSLTNGGILRSLGSAGMKVYDAWYGAGGKLIATAGWGATAIVDARNGAIADTFSADRFLSQHQIAWSSSGVLAVYGTDNANVYLWDASKMARAGSFSAKPLSVSSLAWSPDGSTLAAASREGVTLFRNGTPVKTLRERGPLAYGLAWSPDGARLCTGDERAVTLWDVATGAFTELTHDSGDAMSVAFSADGQLVASASRDGKVRIWDVPSRTFVTTLGGYPQQPRSVSWNPRGTSAGERVLIVAAGLVHLYRPADGRSVWLRSFAESGKRAGLAIADDGAYSGDLAALARVRFRASTDLRSPLSATPATPPQPELVADLLGGCPSK